ncbi:hypothetical protein HRbin07_00308 [bacterium HR07]|uniref:Hypothetical conserved protein n=1 Tax=Acetithermum autotrophicum TaxID=1446466 RepID=H5SRQ1_ACEAU|nr:hypothetical conserved protein [Candidatus Acetothermum autotrophicum]GBC76111.1 hypothetical protein HRbin07_00308 [bacterium HR07]
MFTQSKSLLRDEALFKKLSALRLLVRRRFHGQTGLWTTPRAGMSLEFAEYREYHPGDDFRYVDWNLYGRLDRLFVKVFQREEDVPIYVLIDTSRSMAVGGKLAYAAELAGAIAYVGLKEMNRVGVFPFASDVARGVPPKPGLAHVHHIFGLLGALEPAGQTSLNESLERFSKLPLQRGLALLLSDMLDPQGYEHGLLRLLLKRFEVALIQILAEEDVHPTLRHEARLRDSEAPQEFSVSAEAVARYRENFQSYERALEAFCREHRIRYVQLTTARPLERALFEDLRGVIFQ